MTRIAFVALKCLGRSVQLLSGRVAVFGLSGTQDLVSPDRRQAAIQSDPTWHPRFFFRFSPLPTFGNLA